MCTPARLCTAHPTRLVRLVLLGSAPRDAFPGSPPCVVGEFVTSAEFALGDFVPFGNDDGGILRDAYTEADGTLVLFLF